MTSARKKLIVAAAVFGLIAGVVVLPNFIRARSTSATNACMNNLR
jgi:hypothetical protein